MRPLPGHRHLEVIVAALAFALSVPAGKRLLADVAPLSLSGALYLSAGAFCALLLALSRARSGPAAGSNVVRGSEWLWLAAAVACGGVLAPLALFLGLRSLSGHAAGLLLNFEAVFTIALGVTLSGERLGGRGWVGCAGVVAGAILLAAPGRSPAVGTPAGGAALVLLACALWALDNNLTQRVSLRDARQIVAIKGLVGGSASLGLAALAGQLGGWSPGGLAAACAIGAVSFGLSIVLFVRGLRRLGVVQTATLFALAPGFAAILSWALLGESVGTAGLVALAAMSGGAVLLASDRHEHVHVHEEIVHAHPHEHDEHHRHDHSPAESAAVPHAHPHRHPPVAHAHPHAHDAHHRHGHRRDAATP